MIKNKNKTKVMVIFFIWIVLLILIPLITSKINDIKKKENISYISSGYEIEKYDIALDVGKNSKIDVTENITIKVPNDGQFNGIYKSIPLWQRYYNEDGKEIKRKVDITNFRAIGEKFVLNKKNDKIGIKIGSARTTINSGIHTYTIKYRYNIGKDLNNKKDEFVFNVFDNYDNTSINNVSISINMPKSIEDSKIKFVNENKDITKNVSYKLEDNSIKADINNYKLDKALTIKIDLPNNYFVGSTYNYGYISLCIYIITIAVAIATYIMWAKYGKNFERKYKTVEFYAPDDLDASEVGYVYGETSIKKLVTALLIQLASKNYIAIEKIEGEKYKIINIKENSSKLKKLSINEQLVYSELFKKGNENILSEDKSFVNIFPKINSSLENVFDKKINDNKSKKLSNITILVLLCSVIAWTISYMHINDLNPQLNWLCILSFASIFITGFFAIFMQRKTEYGETITAKVLGFKDYLIHAEKEKIEKLVEKNPNYFYEILPYTYVLGVSEKWIKIFEKNNIPNIDLGSMNNYENKLFII